MAVQQCKAISQHMSVKVKYYTGDMGVDFWDNKTWDKELDENRVLVMTAQILVNILHHGFIKVENINLLVLDECHNATKGHPYVRIMQILDKAKNSGIKQPHIMGLTASIINEKYNKVNLDEKIKHLEETLKSKCITCSDPTATSDFAAKPVESIITYTNSSKVSGYDLVKNIISETKENFYIAYEGFSKYKSV